MVDLPLSVSFIVDLPLFTRLSTSKGKESLNDLVVEAGRKALQMAKVEPDNVDLVLLRTSAPKDFFSGAPQMDDLKLKGAMLYIGEGRA